VEVGEAETRMHSRQIRFVVFCESAHWVAQCLEFDIGAQANSLQEIQRRIPVVLKCEADEGRARYGAPFRGLDEAPRHFRAIWDKRSGGYTPIHAVDVRGVRVDVALCAALSARKYPANLPTLRQYCGWVISAGCGVLNNVFVGERGYAERVTKMTASAVNRALEIGILEGEILAPTTLARLDRRLGLRSLFSHLDQFADVVTGTHRLSRA
jgi:hypothetical protein